MAAALDMESLTPPLRSENAGKTQKPARASASPVARALASPAVTLVLLLWWTGLIRVSGQSVADLAGARAAMIVRLWLAAPLDQALGVGAIDALWEGIANWRGGGGAWASPSPWSCCSP